MSSFRLFLDDVDDVVEREHADETIVVVHHRRRDKIVALEHARHLFRVFDRMNAPAILVHELGNRHRPLGP